MVPGLSRKEFAAIESLGATGPVQREGQSEHHQGQSPRLPVETEQRTGTWPSGASAAGPIRLCSAHDSAGSNTEVEGIAVIRA